jgi:hypothetical protein
MKGADKVISHGLIDVEGPFAILSSWGDTQIVTVSFDDVHQVTNAGVGNPIPLTVQSARLLMSANLNGSLSLMLVVR